MFKYYPVFLKIEGKLCIVIGGGQVAERKIASLLEAGAKIKVISPQITSKIEKWAQERKIHIEKRAYKKGDLKGAWLVIAATDNPQVQEKIYQEAEKEKIFCNIVDVPTYCSFIVPSLVKRGALQIAISTSGASPALARRIREELEETFGPEYEKLLALMALWRKEVLSKNLSPEKRKKILQRLALAPLANWLKEDRKDLLKTLANEFDLSWPKNL